MSKLKGTAFCFTDFLPNNVETGYSLIFKEYNDVIRGLAWGKEVCPSTGKEHNQGYVQFFKQSRFSSFQKMITSKCHGELIRGSIQDNEDYCSKEKNFTKLGIFVSRGYRSDFHNIKDDMKNGADVNEIMENYTGDFIRYHSGIEKMKGLIDKTTRMDWRDVSVTAIVGLAGSGKTRYVLDKHKKENVFIVDQKMMETDFWGNYNGEEVLLIDDFNGWIRYSYLLRILDGHPLWLNIKNSNTYANWKFVYMTSNTLPKCWYCDVKWNLMRRIQFCLYVSKGNTGNLTHREMWGGKYDLERKKSEEELTKKELICLLDKNNYFEEN